MSELLSLLYTDRPIEEITILFLNYLKWTLMDTNSRCVTYSFNGICGDFCDCLDYETHATVNAQRTLTDFLS